MSDSDANDSTAEAAHRRKKKEKRKATTEAKCSECNKVFAGPGCLSNLRRHMSTHTGDRRYTCPHCQAGFTTSQNLARHCGSKHPLLPQPSFAGRRTPTASAMGTPTTTGAAAVFPGALTSSDDDDAVSDVEPPDAAGDRDAAAVAPAPPADAAPFDPNRRFPCAHCDKAFRYESSRRHHLRQYHPDGAVAALPGRGLEVECPDCKALLSSATKLRRHQQKHCVMRRETTAARRNHETGDHFGADSDDGSGAENDDRVPFAARFASEVETLAASPSDDVASDGDSNASDARPPRKAARQECDGGGGGGGGAGARKRRPRRAPTDAWLCPVDGCVKGYLRRSYLREHVRRAHPDFVMVGPDSVVPATPTADDGIDFPVVSEGGDDDLPEEFE